MAQTLLKNPGFVGNAPDGMSCFHACEDARNFLKSDHVEIEQRIPTLDDVRNHIIAGWYVIPTVNSRALNFADSEQARSAICFRPMCKNEGVNNA